MRIVQLSDTHLSHLGGVTSRNFEILAEFVNSTLQPDLVVNSGDLVMLSPDSEADRALAEKLNQSFTAPIRVLPGNHDVGEPGAHPWMGLSTTSPRVNAFRSAYGSDRFVDIVEDGWAVVGLNSELLSSGLPEEDEQWAWLAETAVAVQGRSVLLILHKPLWSPMPGYTEHSVAVSEPDRDRILATLAGARVRAVGSGHLHCYRRTVEGDVLTVWAPSTAFVHLSLGIAGVLNQTGVVEWVLEQDTVRAYFRSIPGMEDHEAENIAEFATALAELTAEVAR